MYNGLTTADKGALLDAKANHLNWIAREISASLYGYEDEPKKTMFGWTLTEGLVIFLGTMEIMPFVGLHEKVNIELALAQIAEMESKQKELLSEKAIQKGCTFCCYTEYPDTTLYPRDKSEFFATRSRQIRVDVFDEDELDDVSFCPNCGRNLNSPYTEGATK